MQPEKYGDKTRYGTSRDLGLGPRPLQTEARRLEWSASGAQGSLRPVMILTRKDIYQYEYYVLLLTVASWS